MKLSDYIEEFHKGNVSEFARNNNYHITQVRRCIEQDGYYNEGEPYFRKYLNHKELNDEKGKD